MKPLQQSTIEPNEDTPENESVQALRRRRAARAYLDWVNNFVTTKGFADHYGLDNDEAIALIAEGRKAYLETIDPTPSAVIGSLLVMLQQDGFTLIRAAGLDLEGTPRQRRQAAKTLLIGPGPHDLIVDHPEAERFLWLNISDLAVIDTAPDKLLQNTLDKFTKKWN